MSQLQCTFSEWLLKLQWSATKNTRSLLEIQHRYAKIPAQSLPFFMAVVNFNTNLGFGRSDKIPIFIKNKYLRAPLNKSSKIFEIIFFGAPKNSISITFDDLFRGAFKYLFSTRPHKLRHKLHAAGLNFN